jgi:hypothetical protein
LFLTLHLEIYKRHIFSWNLKIIYPGAIKRIKNMLLEEKHEKNKELRENAERA